MAQTNDDFKDFMFKHVELMFPRLKDTYRFNTATQKSEQCPPNVNGAAWSVGMKMPKAAAKEFYTQMKAHYEACQSRNKEMLPFFTVFGMKKNDEEGTVVFEAKKRGVTGQGKANKRPNVIDNLKQPWPEEKLDFWSGTTGNVRVRAFPTTSPATKEHPKGQGGISLLIDIVQVLKPVFGSTNLDGFEEEEGEGFGPAEFAGDPFAAAAANKATAASNKADLGDDF